MPTFSISLATGAEVEKLNFQLTLTNTCRHSFCSQKWLCPTNQRLKRRRLLIEGSLPLFKPTLPLMWPPLSFKVTKMWPPLPIKDAKMSFLIESKLHRPTKLATIAMGDYVRSWFVNVIMYLFAIGLLHFFTYHNKKLVSII